MVIVLHGDDWSLQYWAEYMDEELAIKFNLAKEGMKLEPGMVYLAPGDKHLLITDSYSFSLDDGPKECFVKPSANPLFRTAASNFGAFCIGIVFTGLGIDGSAGSKTISAAGGSIIVQEPETAPAPFMPKAAIEAVPNCDINSIENIGNQLPNKVELLEKQLKLK
jgi:two-component system, chemotaxis family, protein-glutamate methylesterase/glutaminase